MSRMKYYALRAAELLIYLCLAAACGFLLGYHRALIENNCKIVFEREVGR